MTFDGTLSYQYDAWNQLVKVSNGSTILSEYAYDGAGRRVEELSSFDGNGNPQAVTYYFFDGQNAIETRSATFAANSPIPNPQSLIPQFQYVWSMRGDKTPLLRDSFAGATAGRLYYLTDANSNVTAVVGYSSGSWGVAERYVYSPYGNVTVYDTNWANPTTTSSTSIQNTLLFAAMDLDPTTGLYYDEARWFESEPRRLHRPRSGRRG